MIYSSYYFMLIIFSLPMILSLMLCKIYSGKIRISLLSILIFLPVLLSIALSVVDEISNSTGGYALSYYMTWLIFIMPVWFSIIVIPYRIGMHLVNRAKDQAALKISDRFD